MFRHMSPKIIFVIGAVFVCIHSIRAADNPGIVQGVVKSASGEALSGAYVKLFNAERRLTFIFISQDQGRYTANNLPPGKYTVQGIGNGYQSKSTPVDVTAGKPATADMSLTDKQGPYIENGWPGTPGTVGGAEVWVKLPQPKLAEGDGKQIVQTKCTQCHELWRITLLRWTKPKWAAMVAEMRERIHEDTTKAKDLTNQEEKIVVDYLAKNYSGEAGAANGRFDPNGRLSRTLLKGDAARYMAVDFEIPTPDTEPHDITVDAMGNGWINERGGCCLGKFDPKTYTFTEVHPPAGMHPVRLGSPAQGVGNMIWMADGGPNRRWLQLNTKTEEWTEYPVDPSIPGLVGGNTMRVAPDGKMVWPTNGNRILGLNVQTKKFVAYVMPSYLATKKDPGGYGMAISGDGKIWFAERDANIVGRLDPSTGKIDEFKTPGFDIPRRMGADADGNIWVGFHETGKLVKYDYKTTKMTILQPPTEKGGVYSVTGDPKSNWIWFSEQTADKIGRYVPKTETWTEFALPIVESDARRIEIDPINSNRIWWSGDTSNHLGYIEILEK